MRPYALMRVFVAGASGAIGRPLVAGLVEAGQSVTAMTRTPGKEAALRAAGAEPVVADALVAAAVADAVARAEPEVVVHELTAIPARLNARRVERDFALTNRLRIEGTDNLLAAARAAGARRLVAQSFFGWRLARSGGPALGEDDPLDPSPPERIRPVMDALAHLESAVLGAQDLEGVVLRYGGFYGPGSNLARDGAMVEEVRKRRLPIVGDGGGVWSFVHVDDAARATVLAIERAAPGLYHVVDDDPAPVREWLPALAEAAGAKRPRRVPVWLARLAVGEGGVAIMTRTHGASNAKARRELGWVPEYASWREGFRRALAN